ncbi:hypothetical protein NPIL_97471 [Nephila pilipes]|uniref:Wntless GOLD domain-containing protein n=1 Tax=Nephila pilipes TaxID=299642 RepID=A0A8X6QR16_NEPPI|nr:hypothetical protein NPIL_97471 [Nephila pilipes]
MPRQTSAEVRNLFVLSTGFVICVLAGYIVGICTGTGPFLMKTLEPTKCLVKQHSGMYEFDDVWHVPMGKKGKPVNCGVFNDVFPQNNSDITMDEIVYAFQIPPFPNESTTEFSKWVPSVEGFLLLEVVFKENHSEELYPQLTFEAKIGYKDRREGDSNWTLIAETTETRNLQCYVNASGSPYCPCDRPRAFLLQTHCAPSAEQGLSVYSLLSSILPRWQQTMITTGSLPPAIARFLAISGVEPYSAAGTSSDFLPA